MPPEVLRYDAVIRWTAGTPRRCRRTTGKTNRRVYSLVA